MITEKGGKKTASLPLLTYSVPGIVLGMPYVLVYVILQLYETQFTDGETDAEVSCSPRGEIKSLTFSIC